MKTLISTLLLCLFVTLSLLFSGCSKDSNPLTSPINPVIQGDSLLYQQSAGSIGEINSSSPAYTHLASSIPLKLGDSLLYTGEIKYAVYTPAIYMYYYDSISTLGDHQPINIDSSASVWKPFNVKHSIYITTAGRYAFSLFKGYTYPTGFKVYYQNLKIYKRK